MTQNTSICWVTRETLPEDGRRVLTLSTVYPRGDGLRHRIMDSQFVRICSEVDFWAYLEEAEPVNG